VIWTLYVENKLLSSIGLSLLKTNSSSKVAATRIQIVDIGAIQSCLLSSNYSVFDNIKQFLFILIKYIEYIERFSCVVSNGVLRWLIAWEHKIWISLLGNFVQIFDGSKYLWWVINAWKQLLEASNLVFLGFLHEIFGCEKVSRSKQGSVRK
jgi:hypothetical protein